MSGRPERTRWLKIAAGLCGLALAAQSVRLLLTMTVPGAALPEAGAKPLAPPHDYRPWYALPVQAGRTEPFQTACEELVREITGRGRFERQDPVAVVLAWMLTGGSGAPGHVDWETEPFILCEHTDLRREVFAHRGPAPAGRYVSPADLRTSPGFDQLLEVVARARADHREKAHLFLSTAQLKAEEAGRRLARYDAVCGRPVTRLHGNALSGGEFLNLREMGATDPETVDRTLKRLAERQVRDPSPLRLVALDRAPDSGWFSAAQVRAMRREPKRWDAVLQERFNEAPHRYLAGGELEVLRQFQQQVRSGRGDAALGELEQLMRRRRTERLDQFASAHKAGNAAEAERLFEQIVRTTSDHERMQRVRDRVGRQKGDADTLRREQLAEMGAILTDADEQALSRLRQALAHAHLGNDDPNAAVFRPLQLEFLEARFPDLYRRSAAALAFPEDEAQAAQGAFDRLTEAYVSGDASRFDAASSALFATLRQSAQSAGQPYPGVDTIPLELTFNRVQPFRWAWVTMLLAALALAIRLALGTEAESAAPAARSPSRVPRRLASAAGFAFGALSLALQVFGFYCRVRISGWAPVSNMYETIIFAALMAFVFALVLELIYRRTIFALTGAVVATLGLILADNLPLESSIGGLVPVLRTNFWLTVHVITIICGYAAGALAWGIGNLTLGMLAFGRGGPNMLKLLSQFTYRALQLTVVLLATGTFLGGWWASEAWGRFWGWDPKEIGALVALICYVIPLHARYIGWVRDFGLAVAAVVCFASIVVSWYVINFVLAAGLHSYGFGGGGGPWVAWAVLLNLTWVLLCALRYQRGSLQSESARPPDAPAAVSPTL